MGGRFVLSDDSHGPKAVGLNYHKLFQFLREEVDLRELYYLRRTGGSTRSKGGRNVEIRVADDWSEGILVHNLTTLCRRSLELTRYF